MPTPPPVSGGGGGGYSGGGSGGRDGCVVCEAWLNNETQAVDVGFGFEADTWNPSETGIMKYPVTQIQAPRASECVTLETVSGITLTCSVSTPFNLKNATKDLQEGQWKYAPDMELEEVMVDDGISVHWEKVVSVKHVGQKMIVPLGFDGRSFAAGDTPAGRIFSHNLVKTLRNF
jgi:hypothetical protein